MLLRLAQASATAAAAYTPPHAHAATAVTLQDSSIALNQDMPRKGALILSIKQLTMLRRSANTTMGSHTHKAMLLEIEASAQHATSKNLSHDQTSSVVNIQQGNSLMTHGVTMVCIM